MLPTHVRKRDGRLVTFDIGKLKRSIEAALLAAEVPGSEYAEDAAYAIAMHLGKTPSLSMVSYIYLVTTI